LDLNPLAWSLSGESSPEDPPADSLTLQQALDQILIFCNAHLSLRHENQVAVFAAGLGKSRQLFSSTLTPSSASTSSGVRDSNTYQQFRVVDERIAEGVREVIAELQDEDASAGTVGLVGALSMALCHINRLNSSSSLVPNLSKPKPRIAIMSVTEDASAQYVPIMNCIFTAQKNNIPIDVCKIFGPDAVFLQQACHLTSGSYFKIQRRAGLLQYLIMAFLPGPSARKHLTQPTQDQVDLRAACFCHRKIVDIGYVCSVCLSIFCSPLPVCSTCRTKFPMATLKRLGFGAKPPGASNGAPRPKKRKIVGGNPASGTGTPTPGPATPA
ncbi:transcription factor Tfb4, partial [Leucosporidium creatinivorum]